MSASDAERELLRDTVEHLFARHCAPERVAAAARTGRDAELWRALDQAALTLAGTSEEAGGSGGDLAAAADIAVAAGAAAAPVPLAETLAAGMLLARGGLDIPPGPLTLAVAGGSAAAGPAGAGQAGAGQAGAGQAGAGQGAASPGTVLPRVPYGRLATTVAAGSGEDGDWLGVIARPAVVRHGRNLAGEPRDEVDPGPDAEVHHAPAGTAEYARQTLRLFRALLIAGAARRALDLTVTYVQEREQFGRPLARFPTVQQELARMAGEVALIDAAAQAAVADCQTSLAGRQTSLADYQTSLAGRRAVSREPGRPEDPAATDVVPAVLAAKAQASHCAGIVAAIAHQLHGAIGTTEEHRLRLTTTRLWSWRDEDGPEAECFAELGQAALAAAGGTGGLWPWLSGNP